MAGAVVADVGSLARRAIAVGVRVVGRGTIGGLHLGVIDAVSFGKGDQEAAVGVVSNEGNRGNRETGIEPLEVDRHVAAGTAAAHLGVEDVGAAVQRRPTVDQNVAIDAPAAAGKDAAPHHSWNRGLLETSPSACELRALYRISPAGLRSS
jgi:hypothetical protein